MNFIKGNKYIIIGNKKDIRFTILCEYLGAEVSSTYSEIKIIRNFRYVNNENINVIVSVGETDINFQVYYNKITRQITPPVCDGNITKKKNLIKLCVSVIDAIVEDDDIGDDGWTREDALDDDGWKKW
jgi:hypothetical protein